VIDMREVTPGSVIDEFHFSMWVGFIEFALKRDEIRAEFEAETGRTFPTPASNGLELMIDEACGFDRSAEQMAYVAEFARWVTPLYFGGPEDICPAIAAKLASSISGEAHGRA
jgi:hypothetical protein